MKKYVNYPVTYLKIRAKFTTSNCHGHLIKILLELFSLQMGRLACSQWPIVTFCISWQLSWRTKARNVGLVYSTWQCCRMHETI